VFSAFVRPSQSFWVVSPYNVNYVTAQASFVCVSFCTFDSHVFFQCWSSQCCVVVDGSPVLFYALLWPLFFFTRLLHVSFPLLYRPGPWPSTIFLLLFPPILPKCLLYFGVVGLFFCRTP